MSIRDNTLKGDRVFDPREGRSVRKDAVLPSIDKQRSEYHAFLAGVEWLLLHLGTYKFIDEPEAPFNSVSSRHVLDKAIEHAAVTFPPYDEFPPPERGHV